MRLMLLVAGLVVGSTMVVIGVVSTSIALLALGLFLAVAMGAALKPELGKERYAGVVRRGRQCLHWTSQHLRLRGPAALLGAILGLIVSGLTLGWWWDLGQPVQCQDLFLPDPRLCGILSLIRSWVSPLFVLVGVLLGWGLRRRSDGTGPTSARRGFEVLGQLVALAALILGARIVAPIAFDLPGYRQSPWPGLAIGSAAIGGGLLYTLGLYRQTSRRVSAPRAIGWLLFSSVLFLPLFTRTYLVRWWIQGALLSAIALPAIATWGDSGSGENSPLQPIDDDRNSTSIL